MNKRKNYFKVYDPLLQKDLLRALAVFWAAWFLLQLLFIYLVLSTGLCVSDAGSDQVQWTILGSVTFSAALFLIAILMFNRLLQQITGPIHRLKMDLDSFVEGKSPGPTQLRKGDYFQSLADSINAAFHKQSSREPGRDDPKNP